MRGERPRRGLWRGGCGRGENGSRGRDRCDAGHHDGRHQSRCRAAPAERGRGGRTGCSVQHGNSDRAHAIQASMWGAHVGHQGSQAQGEAGCALARSSPFSLSLPLSLSFSSPFSLLFFSSCRPLVLSSSLPFFLPSSLPPFLSFSLPLLLSSPLPLFLALSLLLSLSSSPPPLVVVCCQICHNVINPLRQTRPPTMPPRPNTAVPRQNIAASSQPDVLVSLLDPCESPVCADITLYWGRALWEEIRWCACSGGTRPVACTGRRVRGFRHTGWACNRQLGN